MERTHLLYNWQSPGRGEWPGGACCHVVCSAAQSVPALDLPWGRIKGHAHVSYLALSSGIRKLLIEHRIPLSQVLLECGKARLLL